MGRRHQTSNIYIIFLRPDCFNRLPYSILLQVVHNSRDFGNLGMSVMVS
jgi:hypothetical protein